MKKCFKCGELKPLSDFYKHKEMADGYLNKCKECTKLDTKNNEKHYSNRVGSYDRTEKGVIRIIYKTQIRNSKIRKMPPPTYNKDELKIWLYDNNFKELYNNWVKGGYQKNEKPSVDRINSLSPYTMDNIRLVTWQTNRDYQKLDILTGQGSSGRVCKPVVQLDKDFNEVAKYVSLNSARRILGYSMEKCIKSGRLSKSGYYFRYINKEIK